MHLVKSTKPSVTKLRSEISIVSLAPLIRAFSKMSLKRKYQL